jgi:hypothetical protein
MSLLSLEKKIFKTQFALGLVCMQTKWILWHNKTHNAAIYIILQLKLQNSNMFRFFKNHPQEENIN